MFEAYGRLQLIAMVRRGLSPADDLIDLGCGALRAGYWLIHFLDPGRYHGIEPNREMVDIARKRLLEPGLEEAKRPQFAHNDDFDLGVFGIAPRFVLARSVWTHTAKAQIEQMLDSFSAVATEDGLLLASYLPVLPLLRPDYKGGEWVGRGAVSNQPGVVAHSFAWIGHACASRGLVARGSRTDRIGHQVWVEVTRARAGRAAQSV